MDRVQVRVNFNTDGSMSPSLFTWQGTDYAVDSVGRQWREAEDFHLLVMSSDQAVYHLIFKPQEPAWYIVPRLNFPSKDTA